MDISKTVMLPPGRADIGGIGTIKSTTTSRVLSVQPGLTMPDENSSTSAAFSRVVRQIKQGGFIKLNGVVMIYCTIMECWYPLGSGTGMRLLSSIIGADNATVNYHTAVQPFVPLIGQNATVVNVNHTSACLSVCRWLVGTTDELLLTPSHHLVTTGSGGCLAKMTPRQNPVGPNSVCTRLAKDHDCHVSARFSGLFESSTEYETLLRVVGNSIVEPPSTGRIVLLYGVGNNGKSTILREISEIMGPSMCAMDVARPILSNKHSVPQDVVSDLAGCRIANCGDIDLNQCSLNLHVCKMLTGGDMLAGKVTDHALSCAILLGTNSLPSPGGDWHTIAVLRRKMILPMTWPCVAIEVLTSLMM
jgi:hypothetical protein